MNYIQEGMRSVVLLEKPRNNPYNNIYNNNLISCKHPNLLKNLGYENFNERDSSKFHDLVLLPKLDYTLCFFNFFPSTMSTEKYNVSFVEGKDLWGHVDGNTPTPSKN
ncbi:hypothetical protein CR513_37124, partial [Mucuna pruriens]